MLGALRQGGVRQTLMAVIVFAIIAVFILEFRASSRVQTGSLQRECAVSIDGECVTPKDYFAEFGLIVPREVSAKQIKSFSLRKHVMDGLVERELLVAEAKRLGVSAGEDAVKDELRLGRAHVSLPAAHALVLGQRLGLVAADKDGISRDMVRELPIVDPKTKAVADELYSRVVRSMTNRSPKEFLKMQERELVAARMRDLVRAPVRISDEEAFDAFARERSRAVVRSVRTDSDWFARWAVDASDAAVDAWANEHKAEVDEAWKTASSKWKAECPLVSEIVLFAGEGATEAQKTLLQEKIEGAKSRLDAGEPFEDVARSLSNGPTASSGGFIGCLTAEGYGEGGDVLAKATAELAPKAVSAPIPTPRGFHLLRVEGKLAASDVETVGRRTVARPLAARALADAKAKEFATRLVAEVKGGARLDDTATKLVSEFAKDAIATHEARARKAAPKADETAAETTAPALLDPKAPKAEISAPFNLDGNPVPGTYGGPDLARIAFDLPNVDDVTPEPVSMGAGYIVLQLKEKTVATREDFTTSKGEIVKSLEIGKRADALARYVARLRQAKEGKIEINPRMLEEPKNAEQE